MNRPLLVLSSIALLTLAAPEGKAQSVNDADVVYVTDSGTVGIETGTPDTGTPSAPSLTTGQMALAQITLSTGTTGITTTGITSVRMGL